MDNKTVKKYDPSYEVEVQSNFDGILIYISKSTGFEVKWEKIGDTNYMTISDLKEMVATQRDFFKRNWIIINDDEAEDICHFLRVSDCYNANVAVDNFVKDINKMSHKEVCKRIANINNTTKSSIIDAIHKEYESGRLDSISKIKMYEKIFNISIIDDEER